VRTAAGPATASCREPLARLLFEARALAARGAEPELGTAIQLMQRAIDAVEL